MEKDQANTPLEIEEVKGEPSQHRKTAQLGGYSDDEHGEEDVTNALKSVRYLFAMLDHDYFKLYKDLHMQVEITSFKRT